MPRPRIKLHNAKDIPEIAQLNHDYDNLLAAYRLHDEGSKAAVRRISQAE